MVNYSDKLVGHNSLGGSWNLKTYSNSEKDLTMLYHSHLDLYLSHQKLLITGEHTLPITISAGQVAALIADPTSFVGYSASDSITITGNITHTEASA